ncbi:MAG: DoxX family protein [Bdellovibrionales bacterium]|jgi:putative oxidoreductase|nr:DoxX family protein [Bdellovibrionales bacterium]
MSHHFAILWTRVSIGLLMLCSHGFSKLINYSAMSANFPDPLGVGNQVSLCLVIFAEFFCSILLIIGFKTRMASIPLIITMLVAIFIVHAIDPWQKQEVGTLYLVTYLSLLIFGSGRYSVDYLLSKKI